MPPSLYLFGPENSGKDLFIRHAFWCNSIATPVIRDGPRLQKFRIGASNVSMIRVSHKVEPGTPLFARLWFLALFQAWKESSSFASELPYKLYRFSDPWSTQPPSNNTLCTPVLFLPGNQGSYKQARTIGYWLLNNPSLVAGQCYTTYTVDFLEQWSVVSERVVRDQSRFVHGVIEHLQQKYKDKKLVIVGHSMGSVVARLALKEIGDPCLISLVSLAAPMDRSPLSLDNRVGLDYSFPPLQTFSFCGGSADVQIVPFPSTVDGERRCTETIPMVWSSSDHQSIVWAHQVIEHIGRLIHSL